MPLNSAQLYTLRNIRSEQWIYGIKFISLNTGAGYSALDAYRKISYSENFSYFSGALLSNPYINRRDDVAGFYNTSDIIIVCSRDNRATAQTKNVKIEYDSIHYRVNKIIDCEDTNEIVITASRLE